MGPRVVMAVPRDHGMLARATGVILVIVVLYGSVATSAAIARPKRLAKGLMSVGNTGEWPRIIDVWVPYLAWSDLQPRRHTFRFRPIDDLIARARSSGDVLRLRIFAGREAPRWVKRRFGTVEIHDPVDGVSAAVPRWWKRGYMRTYRRLQARLAARYDDNPTVRAVSISGAMTIYAEPFIRGIASSETRRNLLRAGYTPRKDRRAIVRSVEAHRSWRRTRQTLSFNPWQFVRRNGSAGIDTSFTNKMMNRFRRLFGRRAILHNSSIRSSYLTDGMPSGYAEMYRHMRSLGGPLSYQTARNVRVGDLALVLEWCIDQGAHGVEVHKGSTDLISRAEAESFDAILERNA